MTSAGEQVNWRRVSSPPVYRRVQAGNSQRGRKANVSGVLYRRSDWSENEDTSQAPPSPLDGFNMACIHPVFSFDSRASTRWTTRLTEHGVSAKQWSWRKLLDWWIQERPVD